MKYKIVLVDKSKFEVWRGFLVYGDFEKEAVEFTGRFADCYAFVKAKEEGLV